MNWGGAHLLHWLYEMHCSSEELAWHHVTAHHLFKSCYNSNVQTPLSVEYCYSTLWKTVRQCPYKSYRIISLIHSTDFCVWDIIKNHHLTSIVLNLGFLPVVLTSP